MKVKLSHPRQNKIRKRCHSLLSPDFYSLIFTIRSEQLGSLLSFFARRALQIEVEFKLLSVIFLLRALFEEGYLAEISTSARAVFQGLSFLVAHIHTVVTLPVNPPATAARQQEVCSQR